MGILSESQVDSVAVCFRLSQAVKGPNTQRLTCKGEREARWTCIALSYQCGPWGGHRPASSFQR